MQRFAALLVLMLAVLSPDLRAQSVQWRISRLEYSIPIYMSGSYTRVNHGETTYGSVSSKEIASDTAEIGANNYLTQSGDTLSTILPGNRQLRVILVPGTQRTKQIEFYHSGDYFGGVITADLSDRDIHPGVISVEVTSPDRIYFGPWGGQRYFHTSGDLTQEVFSSVSHDLQVEDRFIRIDLAEAVLSVSASPDTEKRLHVSFDGGSYTLYFCAVNYDRVLRLIDVSGIVRSQIVVASGVGQVDLGRLTMSEGLYFAQLAGCLPVKLIVNQ
jgi:hypothetical protein